MRLRFSLLLSGLLLATLIITTLGSHSSMADTDTLNVKVGCLFPLVGPGGRYGRDSVVAIDMAKEEVKRSEAFSHLNLDIAIGDTRSKTLRAVQIARQFVKEDNVDFLCGVVSSGIALAITEMARDNQVFFIGTDHASPRLVSEALHPYYFRVSNDTRQSMQAGAKYIRHHYFQKQSATETQRGQEQSNQDSYNFTRQTQGSRASPLRIAFIGPDYDYGYQAWADLRAFLHAESVNFEIVGEFWPKLFATDYRIYVHALLASEADIVVNGQWGQDFIRFIKQAQRLDFFDKTVLMNFDAGGNYETFAELGDDMPLGVVLSARHHVNWPDTDGNRRFVEQFRERVGHYPSYAAQGAYAGVLAIAHAVTQAGGTQDKQQLRQRLEQLSMRLPEDPNNFISRMDPVSHQLLQAQAIGKTTRNTNYPPATVLLDDWFIHYPQSHWPKKSETLSINAPGLP